MAIMNAESPILYGHGAIHPSREKAGYNPRPSQKEQEHQKEPGFIYNLLQQLLYKLVDEDSLNDGGYYQFRPPKGNPDSYN
jgi:hypothetical protein